MKSKSKDEMEYFGVVYGSHPTDPFYKLSREDLQKMDLVGLPVKLEHSDKTVGVITHSKLLDNGTLMIKYKLNSNVSGYVVDQLINDGHLTELSMSHVDNGITKTPTEVSVVFKGARPETKIIKPDVFVTDKRYINKTQKTSNFVKASIMSATTEAVDLARPAEPVAKEDEPPAKKSKVEEDTPVEAAAQAPVATPEAAPEDRLSILEKIVSSIPDQEGQKKLYEMTSDMMAELIKYQVKL